jgi:hypothetical protein
MKRMKKSTLAAFGIAVGLAVLGLSLVIGVWAGCSPLLLAVGPAAEAGGAAEGALAATEGDISPAGDGELLLVLYPFGKDAPARSVVGAGSEDIQSRGRGVRNYAQIIVMEDSGTADGAIFTFDQTTASKSALSVKLKAGKTYHFLILHGHKNDVSSQTEKPTLLAGGYAKKALVAGKNELALPLVPVLVDAALNVNAGNGAPGSSVPYSPAQGASLSPGTAYLAQVKLGAVQAEATATGDGLWPLKLAEPAVRREGIWESNSAAGEPGSFATKISLGGYAGGNVVLDAAGITVTQNTGHYVFGASDALLNDSLAAGTQTAGSLKYAFTTGALEGGGRFYFNLEYTPFAVTAARWGQTGMPSWVIRNGFDDAAQDGNTSFAGDFINTSPTVNGHGAIGITVGAVVHAVPPQITVQPQGASYAQNAAATALNVSATVSDGGVLTYQWYSNGTNNSSGGTVLTGAAAASYTPLTTAAGTVYYYVVVTNTNNAATSTKTASATSNTAAVTVTNSSAAVTSVMVSPSTASVQKGAFQYFSATVQGTNNPAQTVTWTIVETVVGGTGITTAGLLTVAEGETAASLTVRATSTADTGKYGEAEVTIVQTGKITPGTPW